MTDDKKAEAALARLGALEGEVGSGRGILARHPLAKETKCLLCADLPSSSHPDIPPGGLRVYIDSKGIHRSRYCECEAGDALKEGHHRPRGSGYTPKTRGFRTAGDF
jgi:hypothetical protein